MEKRKIPIPYLRNNHFITGDTVEYDGAEWEVRKIVPATVTEMGCVIAISIEDGQPEN